MWSGDQVTRIAKLEEEINTCEADIRHAAQKAEMAMDAGDERMFDYWAKKEEQLRKKEEQLRKEKEQLRELTMQQGEPPQVRRPLGIILSTYVPSCQGNSPVRPSCLIPDFFWRRLDVAAYSVAQRGNTVCRSATKGVSNIGQSRCVVP